MIFVSAIQGNQNTFLLRDVKGYPIYAHMQNPPLLLFALFENATLCLLQRSLCLLSLDAQLEFVIKSG